MAKVTISKIENKLSFEKRQFSKLGFIVHEHKGNDWFFVCLVGLSLKKVWVSEEYKEAVECDYWQ